MTKSSRPITEEQPAPGQHGDTQKRKKPNPSGPITEEQPRTDKPEGENRDK